MASTYSTNLAIELVGAGEQTGTWGLSTNNNLGNLIEQAISGITTYTCTGGSDTITIPNGASGIARNMYLELIGIGGGSLIVPSNKKLYFIFNNTTLPITVKVVAQTGVSVPAGAKTILVMNSAQTDIVSATNYSSSLTLGTALPVASGGTGGTATTPYAVYAGNAAGTAFTAVAPGVSGTVLASNGVSTSPTFQALTAFSGTATLSSGSTISDGTTAFSVGYLNIPQNAQSSNYTLVLADGGKHVYSTNSGAQSITIPTNASVAFPTGTAFTIVNNGTTSISINAAAVTLYQAGTTNTGNRTLDLKGMATLLKVATDTWFISGSGVS
jgi:hypothetical protein